MDSHKKKHILGIDLGGTKIEAALIPADDPTRPLARLRLPTEAHLGYDHIVSQIIKLCDMVKNHTGAELPDAIGIGTPGITDPRTGTMKNSNTTCLIGRPLHKDLETGLGRSIIMTNDANCFALAEATWGAARGYNNIFGVIMGTGVGAGIVINGKIVEGRHGIAGEWGQIILDPSGPASVYGTRGTIESHISGTGLQNYYKSLCGEDRKLPDIVARARLGQDKAAVDTLEMLKEKFSQAIIIIMNVLDPEAIVLGGGVGNVEELYSEEVRKKIARYMFNDRFESALLKPALGDSAGVFGAAMLTVM
jgi:fructokinase